MSRHTISAIIIVGLIYLWGVWSVLTLSDYCENEHNVWLKTGYACAWPLMLIRMIWRRMSSDWRSLQQPTIKEPRSPRELGLYDE